jgi:DNA polymerase elongation subunit (family B)
MHVIVLSGVIVVRNLIGVRIPLLKGTGVSCKITYVDDEASLVHELVKCIKKWDPDILSGYEVSCN